MYSGGRNAILIDKSMSNINEGVELSTGRQEEDGNFLKLIIYLSINKI